MFLKLVILMKERLKNISVHLLDLGKRNRLLNYKESGYRTIDVINDDLEKLFNKITNSTTLSILNLDPLLSKYHKVIDASGEAISDYNKGKVKDIVSDVIKANDVLCYKQGFHLSKIFKIIYKECKTTLLEKGINVLYMTFGLITYKEKRETYKAPLLLIPINIDLDNNTYKIKEYEDEIIVNPTLQYLLKTEHKIELPDFDPSVHTYDLFINDIKNVIFDKDVEFSEHSSIGIYSFLKMNMFKDLTTNSDEVIKNTNILRLLDQKTKEDEIKNLPIYPVVDADSSQLEAIKSATSGKSFVLQGPPGSGKSQTITNIISSAIGNGKKVLFVSEKLAALNVVYENLRRVGLESFALELHSHKANKKEFIDELYRTAILPKYEISSSVENVFGKHDYLEAKLIEYRANLHKVINRLNMSLYEVFSRHLTLGKSSLAYRVNNVNTLDVLYLEDVKRALGKYALVSETLGDDYRLSIFRGFIEHDLNYTRFNAKGDLEFLFNYYEELLRISNVFNSKLPLKVRSYHDLLFKIEEVEKVVNLTTWIDEYNLSNSRDELYANLESYLSSYEYVRKSSIDKFFNLDILRLNVLDLYYEFKKVSMSFFKFLNPKYHKVKKEIKLYTKLKMKDNELLIKLEELCTYKKELDNYESLKKVLPEGYKHHQYENMYNDLFSLKDMNYDFNLNHSEYYELKEQLLEALMSFSRNKVSLNEYLHIFDNQVIDLINGDISTVRSALLEMNKQIQLLDLHVQRLNLLEEINTLNVMPYLNKALDEGLSLKQLSDNYESLFLEANIFYEIESNPILKEFSGLGVDSLIEEFKKIDKSHFEANKATIISRLSNLRPDDSILSGSKFSILIKEYNKTRKQKPIRILLEELFDLILDIKPVFLMSPLSVSTYLNSKYDMFDLVVFDEASQVFAWDALGAIYRAKQCIIIGDSKQMPPANFFTATIGLEEYEDESYEDDLESILDKGSSVLPTIGLRWHYRSKSEELIAFSNKSFYESRLITIPQAKKKEKGFGIDHYYLENGRYEAKTRINKEEAKFICDLVFEHFKNNPEQSLGVVAFSNAQADYIANMIDEYLYENPEYAQHFSLDVKEPFFVKNLETVQGDERDRIIFSICYGYNEEGKFYQRFGPLNNVGGERRLNVAITRAKYNVSVVSSILGSDIRTESTESVGVKLLKGYLEYIDNIEVSKRSSDDNIDGVINDVYNCLTDEGYVVERRIGVSDFRIDLAVKHPVTDEYMVAIMLDGPSYKIGNCSDVNRLQEMLLNRLGWKFYRLFSTLWINNNVLEKERLLKFLELSFNEEITKKENAEEEDSFLIENEDDFDDSFEKYETVTDDKIKELYQKKSTAQVIKYIVSKEEPIHKEYLLKRICFMYGRTKVTNIVRNLFELDLEELNLVEENNFLSTKPIMKLGLRIGSDRQLEYVYTSELEDAIYKVVKKSNGITKLGCFKKVVELLGYNRISDNSIKLLEDALVFLKLDGKIIERDECLFS